VQQYLDVIETLLEHSLMEAHREMRRTREREKGGGEISSRNWRNKVKVRSLAFARKLGLILILSGASQHEKPCRSSRNRGKSFESSMLVLMISRKM
jgi:hypothetical protein